MIHAVEEPTTVVSMRLRRCKGHALEDAREEGGWVQDNIVEGWGTTGVDTVRLGVWGQRQPMLARPR